MSSTFIDQSVVTGGTGTINVPIPGTAMAGDLVIAFGMARQTPATSLYTFGPNVWTTTESNGTNLDGITDPDPFQWFCARKIYAGETDLVLTPAAPTINHVQTVLQVWRGAAQLFAGSTGEYDALGGTAFPASLPKDSSTAGLGALASPTAIIGGNIAFSACLAWDATTIGMTSAEGFTNYSLESNIRIDVRGFTQGEGGSTYPTPTYSMSPASWVALESIGFSGAPAPVDSAEWTIPLLEWSAEGAVEPFVPTGGVQTKRFDAGNGTAYYLVAPIIDSGNELRSKVLKAVHQTGKRTNANVKIYAYDIDDEINITDLEDGTNSTTGAVPLDDSARVAQSEREQVNCPNAVLSTVRVEGDDTGEATRDRIDEIVVEQAIQGVRR